MTEAPPQFAVRLASDQSDLHAAQRLRYEVFVEELGGGGAMVDHANRREQDRFDPFFDHLLLLDQARPEISKRRLHGCVRPPDCRWRWALA